MCSAGEYTRLDGKVPFGILSHMNTSTITIIDDANLRGLVASSSLVSKEMLEDFVDVVEMSNPAFVKEVAQLRKEADRDNSWIPFEKVEQRAKKAR
jgi:hypothetical protein